jgi:PAS domain S-box-containing protein
MVGLKGARRRMQTRATPVALSDGTLAQLAVAREVTELNARTRELEGTLERLRESERSFELLVDSVTDYALYMLDPTGRIVSWNSGARRIKGYDAAEIIGKNFECFYSEQDRAAGIPAAGLRTAAREGRLETEGWRLRKDGTRFWANVIIDAIHSDGQLVGFAKITRDITERRDAEARLRQAQKMEAVGQFTGGAAHDFNNLLMAVLGSLELLRKRLPNDPRLLTLLDNAMLAAKRGSSLTQRMLAFARRQELKHEAVDIAALVNSMLELLERSLGPTINIETEFPLDVVRVRTDTNQLETALLNLAINGRDAMPNGGNIRMSVREHSITGAHVTNLPPGKYACLAVADSGHGMDEATMARATEPFFTTKGICKGRARQVEAQPLSCGFPLQRMSPRLPIALARMLKKLSKPSGSYVCWRWTMTAWCWPTLPRCSKIWGIESSPWVQAPKRSRQLTRWRQSISSLLTRPCP